MVTYEIIRAGSAVGVRVWRDGESICYWVCGAIGSQRGRPNGLAWCLRWAMFHYGVR